MDINLQKKRKRIKRNRIGDVIAAIILLIVVGALICTLIGFLRYNSLKLVQAESGVFEETIPAEVIVIRNEYVVTADTNGEFSPLLDEGERVKENGAIGKITKEATDSFQAANTVVYANQSGMISYNIDGWENILQPDSLGQMDWLRVLSLLRSQFSTDADNTNIHNGEDAENEINGKEKLIEIADENIENLSQGRIVARIVDNLIDYQLFVYCAEGIGEIADSNIISLKLDIADHSQVITGGIIESGILPDGSEYLLLSVSSTISEFFEYRYAEAMILGASVEGIVVPKSSIIEKSDGKYIYIQKKRNIMLTEIEVIATSEDFAIVDGIDITDFVVANPKKAKDGQKIY